MDISSVWEIGGFLHSDRPVRPGGKRVSSTSSGIHATLSVWSKRTSLCEIHETGTGSLSLFDRVCRLVPAGRCPVHGFAASVIRRREWEE